MIPFLAPLALKLAPVGKVVRSIPRQVWIALAVALIVFLGVRWHQGQVSDAREAGYEQGKIDEAARTAEAVKKLAARAEQIAANIRSKTDETNRRIAGDADAVRVSGPGKAACPNPAAASPGGRVTPSGTADASVDQVPDREGVELIGLPFADLVGFAERHDLCRTEALAWRENQRKQEEAAKLPSSETPR